MRLNLSQLITALEGVRSSLPDDAPVNVWLLAESPHPLDLAVMNITDVIGGVDRQENRLCATLKLMPKT